MRIGFTHARTPRPSSEHLEELSCRTQALAAARIPYRATRKMLKQLISS